MLDRQTLEAKRERYRQGIDSLQRQIVDFRARQERLVGAIGAVNQMLQDMAAEESEEEPRLRIVKGSAESETIDSDAPATPDLSD